MLAFDDACGAAGVIVRFVGDKLGGGGAALFVAAGASEEIEFESTEDERVGSTTVCYV